MVRGTWVGVLVLLLIPGCATMNPGGKGDGTEAALKCYRFCGLGVTPLGTVPAGGAQFTAEDPSALAALGYGVIGSLWVMSPTLTCYKSPACVAKDAINTDTTSTLQARATQAGAQLITLVVDKEPRTMAVTRQACEGWNGSQVREKVISSRAAKKGGRSNRAQANRAANKKDGKSDNRKDNKQKGSGNNKKGNNNAVAVASAGPPCTWVDEPGVAEGVASAAILWRLIPPQARNTASDALYLEQVQKDIADMTPPIQQSELDDVVDDEDATKPGPVDDSHAVLLSPITAAAEKGDLAEVTRLIEGGADPNPPGYTPLMAAARYGQVPVINYLLAHGADIKRTSAFWTVMFIPLDQDQSTFALPKGGSEENLAISVGLITITRDGGWSAMGLAATSGQLAAVRRLHAAGAPYPGPPKLLIELPHFSLPQWKPIDDR